jgi:hypothetical protein
MVVHNMVSLEWLHRFPVLTHDRSQSYFNNRCLYVYSPEGKIIEEKQQNIDLTNQLYIFPVAPVINPNQPNGFSSNIRIIIGPVNRK